VLPGDLDPALARLGLAAARTMPLAWAVPIFGGPALPTGLRAGLGLGLAVLCYPGLTGSALPPSSLAWVLLLGREMVVGMVMAFVFAAMFRAAQAAGVLMDEARGAYGKLARSPVGQDQSSPLGVLMNLLACVVFLHIGGLRYLATALARSYDAIPIDATLRLGPGTQSAARLAMVASVKLIESAVGLAAPVLVALLLTDLALGAIGRAVPRVSVQFLGAPLRALLGLGAILLAVGALDVAVQAGFRGFFGLLTSAFHLGQ
jgi:type III secretory pathway component EscT